MKRADSKLQAELAMLEAMTPSQVRQCWVEAGATTSPALPPALLRRLLAQQLQERQLGGLPALVVRELQCAAGDKQTSSRRQAVPLAPGARLVREWNGQTIAVEVRANGFWWNDQTWRSLSEIARKVTGAHWSGPRFFGLNRRG